MIFNELFINFHKKWGHNHDVIFFSIIFYLSKIVVNKQVFIRYRNNKIDFNHQQYLDLLDDYFVKNKPLAHIVGYAIFLKLKFLIDKKIFVPRQNTEIMIQQFIDWHKNDKARQIVDLCCGSGCIGISIKKNFPHFHVTCVDRYKKPILNTIKNAKFHKVMINVVKLDVLKYLKKCQSLDIFISNPPYINYDNFNDLKITKWEDKKALFAQQNGLFYIKEFLNWLSQNKFKEAWIEFGYDQYQKIKQIIKIKNNLIYKIMQNNNFMIVYPNNIYGKKMMHNFKHYI